MNTWTIFEEMIGNIWNYIIIEFKIIKDITVTRKTILTAVRVAWLAINYLNQIGNQILKKEKEK